MLTVREMKVVEVEELPRKITWIGCLREPIRDGHHKVVGYIEWANHKAFVKRGFKVNALALGYMDSSD